MYKDGNSVSAAGLGETLLSMMLHIATTTPCNQVWEDVTAESQAFQPERNKLPL